MKDMSKPHYIPEGFHTVTPYFVVEDGARFLEFLQRAFEAREISTHRDPDGRIMHSEVRLGDSIVEFGEAGGPWGPMRLNLHLYVPDTDTVYARAVAAGAKILREPTDEAYGERSAGIEDPAGNIWWIATRIAEESAEELGRRKAAL
jgi:PhnB protein